MSKRQNNSITLPHNYIKDLGAKNIILFSRLIIYKFYILLKFYPYNHILKI